MAPKKSTKPKSMRADFVKKHFVSLKRVNRTLNARLGQNTTKRAAAKVNAFMNFVVQKMIDDQFNQAGSSRITSAIATRCNNELGYVEKSDVIESLVSKVVPLVHKGTVALLAHN